MIKDLCNELDKYHGLDAIIVEGYDGVGKGKILSELSDYYGVKPYRPDYNLWQQFDLRKSDRWKISGFFWDVYSHFYKGSRTWKPMLFDRGVISGAVYNDDTSIATHYKEILRDMKVLHILVTCSAVDYKKFYEARHTKYKLSDLLEECDKFAEYNQRYIEALELAEVDYLVYVNEYDEMIDHHLCKSCGHYSYGVCRHPLINDLVDGENKRCDLSQDKEVQDYDAEVHSMQS